MAPQTAHCLRRATLRSKTSCGTSRCNTRGPAIPISVSSRSRHFACSTVRGKPSIIRFAFVPRDSAIKILICEATAEHTVASSTNSPLAMICRNRKPPGVSCLASRRNIAPVEMQVNPNRDSNNELCVPLPLPGAPISRITRPLCKCAPSCFPLVTFSVQRKSAANSTCGGSSGLPVRIGPEI